MAQMKLKLKGNFWRNSSSNKGVNLPNTDISMPCLTEKDLVDLDFALKHKLDWVGLSFVRNSADIIELKTSLKKEGFYKSNC